MTSVHRTGRRVGVLVALATVFAALALWAGTAQAAGTPSAPPNLASSTHPSQTTWYPVTNAAFTWGAATESGGTIAGYSFTFDQNQFGTPPVLSGAALSYGAKVNYTVGSDPAEIRVADLNGDGKLDLVVENSGSNTVSVLLGNGDGTFKPAVNYATGADPWSLQIGDVNGDGKLDIVTCNESASTVSVLLGNGDGTFQPAVNYTTGSGTSPECMRLGDLTGDGSLDIVTANAGTNNISVLRNNGDGTFATPVMYSTATHPTSIAIGDLNGDGKQDVVTANYETNNVSVLMGNGDGTFKAAVNYTCGATPQTVELADCNNDGHLDIVTANYNATASVLLNKGNGTFATNVDYATGAGPYSLSLADLNHDGNVDIVTVNHTANNVSVLLGNGDGTFQAHSDYSTGNGPFWVGLGDFNGDGYGDLAVTNYTDGTVSVLLGSGYYRPASATRAASFTGVKDGTWYFHVRAIDTGGAAGPTSSYQINVDTVAPVTTATGLQSSASTGWVNTQTVTLTAADTAGAALSSGVAATYYTIDGTQYTYNGSGFTVSTAGSHVITYWSVDKAGNTEAAHTGYVNIDSTAPVTSVATSPTGWTNGSVQVTLSAADTGGAGVATTYYRIGSGTTQTYSGAFTVSDATPVTYWSTDNAGNSESAKTLTPMIDKTAPITAVATDPAGWTNGSVQVTLSASDAGGSGLAATYYKVGDGDPQTYSKPFTVSDATPVTYWSTDRAGNAEQVNTLDPQIDTTAPVTTATTDPTGWTNGSVQVTLSASDAGGSGLATTYYKIGDGDPQTYSGPFAVSDATPVTYWSTDNAGNSESAKTLTPQIDTTAPVTTATTDPSGWTNGDVTVTLSATDQGGSGLNATYYKIGDGDPQTYSGPFAVSDATPVTYWSTDNAGNSESAKTLTPQIDTTAPVTTATTDPSGWTNGDVTVTLSATDQGGSGLNATYYKIGDGDPQTYSGPFTVSTAAQISYWSTDRAGNAEQVNTLDPQIDTTAPVTTATTDPSDWTNGPVTVTLAATDQGGSGLDVTYYKIGDGDPQTYSGAFTVSDATPVTYWSTDNAGNSESAKTLTPQIDTTAPVTTATTDPSGWTNGDVTVTLAATDQGGSAVKATYYKIGDGDPQTYSKPFTVSDATPVTYWSTDNAGNVEDRTGNVLTPQIDTTAPVTTATTDPSGWTNGDVTVTLAATDQGGSAVKATYYKVGDGDPQTYSKPFTVSDATPVTYWSTDRAGNAEQVNTLDPQIDTTAPVTTATTDPTGWTNGSVQVTLSASDAGGSGLATTYYKIGDGDPQTYSGPFAVSDATPVTYWSTDNAGNSESAKTLTPQIDTTAPVTTATTDPSGWTNGDVTVTLSATDQGGSGLNATYYKIGDGDPQTYSGPFAVSDATPVTYWSTDNAGNVEDRTGNVLTPQIDTTAPVVTDDVATTWQHTAQQITIDASDQGGSGLASLTCTVNGVDQQLAACGGSFTVSGQGVYSIVSSAIDNAGNQSAPVTRVLRIDTTAPVTTATTDPSGWTNGPVTVTLSATDQGGSGLNATYYKIGDGDPQTYSGPFTVSDATPVTYWSTDNAGNVEDRTGNVLTPQIDTTAPVTTSADLAATAGAVWQTGPVQVQLDASDAQSGVASTYYQVDDQGWQLCKGVFQVSGDGSHEVDYYSVDNVGNVEKPYHEGWVDIDSTPPTIHVDGLQSKPDSGWQTTDQQVTLDASDSGSGLAALTYSIDAVVQPAYSQPFTVSGNGSHLVAYSALDNAGNVASGYGYVNIDSAAPHTTATNLVAAPDTDFVLDAQSVTLTAVDGESGVAHTYYTLDGGAQTEYTVPFTVAGVGSHTITYWSVDALGNREDTQTGYVNIAPAEALLTAATGLSATNDSGWTQTPVDVTLTANDAGQQSGTYSIVTHYRIDGGAWQTYNAPFTISASGSHRVDYYSSDSLGTTEQTSTGFVNIDTTPPVTLASGPTTPQRVATVVKLSPSDAQSGVASTFFTLDKQTPQRGTNVPVAAPANHSMDGVHTITYYSVDEAGNVEAPHVFTVRIDTIRPVFTYRGTKSLAGRRNGSVKLQLRARDAGGTCTLVLKLTRKVGKKVKTYQRTVVTRHTSKWQTLKFSLRGLPRGTYTVVLRLSDPAGNLSVAKTVKLTVR